MVTNFGLGVFDVTHRAEDLVEHGDFAARRLCLR
jgi:hypothetical protein